MKQTIVIAALCALFGTTTTRAQMPGVTTDPTLLAASIAQAQQANAQPTAARANPSVAGDKRTIVAGERFKCVLESPLRPRIASDTLFSCRVLDDVHSRSNKKTVIPRGSKLVGALEDGRVLWFGWATPDGYSVHIDRTAHGALISTVPSDPPSELQIVAVRDVQVEFPAK